MIFVICNIESYWYEDLKKEMTLVLGFWFFKYSPA